MFLHCCISESKEKLLFFFYCRHGWHRALLLIFAFGNYEEGCNCMANFQSGTNEWSIPLWLHCIAMNSTIKTQRSIKQCLKTDCCPWTFLCVSETSEIVFILFFLCLPVSGFYLAIYVKIKDILWDSTMSAKQLLTAIYSNNRFVMTLF